MEQPFFSVIIPAYNVELYIEQCINSVLVQKCKSFEIILVDDGSTDSTAEICDKYIDDERVFVIHKRNGGLSDARNAGLEKAKGEYVVFLDSDDYWDDSNFLNNASKKLKKQKADLLIFGYKKFFENHIKSIYTPHGNAKNIVSLVNQNEFNICAWDKIIRRKVLTDNKILFRKGVFSEDMEWCARVYSSIDTCIIYSEAPYMYRERKGSITKTITKKNVDDVKNNYGRCLEIKKVLCKEKQHTFDKYLSKNFSMFLIVLSQIDKKDWKEYYGFINKNKTVLRSYTRNRERIISYFLFAFGIRITLKMIGFAYSKKEK